MKQNTRVLFVHEDEALRYYFSFITTRIQKLDGVNANIVESPETAYKRLMKREYDVILSGTRFDNDLNAWEEFYERVDTPFGLLTCTDPEAYSIPSLLLPCKPKHLKRFIDDILE